MFLALQVKILEKNNFEILFSLTVGIVGNVTDIDKALGKSQQKINCFVTHNTCYSCTCFFFFSNFLENKNRIFYCYKNLNNCCSKKLNIEVLLAV